MFWVDMLVFRWACGGQAGVPSKVRLRLKSDLRFAGCGEDAPDFQRILRRVESKWVDAYSPSAQATAEPGKPKCVNSGNRGGGAARICDLRDSSQFWADFAT